MDNKSAEPVPPFHVRQLTIEDGLTLAASPQPAAWQVYDALEPFPPDEGYWAVAAWASPPGRRGRAATPRCSTSPSVSGPACSAGAWA
jgi:hypothetical protein